MVPLVNNILALLGITAAGKGEKGVLRAGYGNKMD